MVPSATPRRRGAGRVSGRARLGVLAGVAFGLLAAGLASGPGAGFAAEPGKESSAAGEEGERAPTAAELGAKLKAAAASGDAAAAAAALEGLAGLGTSEAALAISRNAFRGSNYAVERAAGAALARLKDPAARAKVYEEAKANPDYRARIVLLAVAARLAREDPRALAAVHAALKDPSKPVVLTALYWVRQLRRNESVEPLIGLLEARERKAADRPYFDALRALEELTGFQIGSAGEWRSFWEAQKKGLSAPKISRDSKTGLARKSRFFTVNLDSDRVLFVIDTSWSMTKRDPYAEPQPEEKQVGSRGKTVVAKPRRETGPPKAEELPLSRERLYRVKEELMRSIRELPPHVHFGVLSFNHELAYLWSSRTLQPAAPAAKAQAVEWVKALQANGATRTDLALAEALSIPEVDTIVLLTDGAPQDEKNQRLDIDAILRDVKERNRFVRARIETVSFLQIRDARMRRFVRDLALGNDGGEPHLLP